MNKIKGNFKCNTSALLQELYNCAILVFRTNADKIKTSKAKHRHQKLISKTIHTKNFCETINNHTSECAKMNTFFSWICSKMKYNVVPETSLQICRVQQPPIRHVSSACHAWGNRVRPTIKWGNGKLHRSWSAGLWNAGVEDGCTGIRLAHTANSGYACTSVHSACSNSPDAT